MVDDNIVPRAFHLSDMGQAQDTNDTPLPPSKEKKDVLDTSLVWWETFNHQK